MTFNECVFWSIVLKVIWCAAVFGTAAYAVFWLGHSGWWFVLAFVVAGLCPTFERDTEASK